MNSFASDVLPQRWLGLTLEIVFIFIYSDLVLLVYGGVWEGVNILLEDVVEKLKSELSSKLPAELDAIDTARTDAIVLRDPVVYYTTPISRRLAEAKYPSVSILGDIASIVEQEFAQVSGGGAGTRRFTHEIDIIIMEREVSNEDLQKRLWRYQEAVDKVLNKNPTLDSTVQSLDIISFGYTEIKELDGNAYERGAGITLLVEELVVP